MELYDTTPEHRRTLQYRADEENARRDLERCYSPTVLPAVLTMLADAIELAHEGQWAESWRWEVTLWPADSGVLRLNVGPIETVVLKPDRVAIVMKSNDLDRLKPSIRKHLTIEHVYRPRRRALRDHEPVRISVGGTDFVHVYEAYLRASHHAIIQAAKPEHVTGEWERAHSPGVLF